MADVRDLLERRAREWRPSPRGWERVERRVHRRRQARRLGSAVLALAVFAVALGGLWFAFRPRVQPVNQPPSPTPTAPAVTIGPAWLSTFRMTSASGGWGLAWSGNPSSPAPVHQVAVRTTDGGAAWRVVTPPDARRLLASRSAQASLFALDASHAWLAVSRSVSDGATTTVFATADGGASWTSSGAFPSAGVVTDLTFVDPSHGWLLADLGAAMGSQGVALFRTVDGGGHWSQVAGTAAPGAAGTTAYALPLGCDKTGIAFADASTGWMTGACNGPGPFLYVTHRGGLGPWTPEASGLPSPASSCSGGCGIWPVAGLGSTQILLVSSYPASGLLVTHDLGATWTFSALPSAGVRKASPFPQDVTFPDAAHGFALVGDRLVATDDGGATWRTVPTTMPRLRAIAQAGILDFVTPRVGFASQLDGNTAGAEPTLLMTADGGHTWARLTPQLVR